MVAYFDKIKKVNLSFGKLMAKKLREIWRFICGNRYWILLTLFLAGIAIWGFWFANLGWFGNFSFEYKISSGDIISLLAIAIATIAFCFQYQSLQQQKIIGAWQILITKAVGNSGKREALELLAKKGFVLNGIDLSAKTNGAVFDKKSQSYKRGVFLGGLNLGGANLVNANFEGAVLYGANFEGAGLSWAKFEGAYLVGANFEGAGLSWAKFEGAHLFGAKFEGANLSWVNFEGANLGWAKFRGAFGSGFFIDNYVHCLPDENINDALPTAPLGYKFEFDGRVAGDKHYIKLVKVSS
jgi:uncharacterized protein YjbI with pentapeptide repeats